MDINDLLEKAKKNKYNDWGHREPLVCNDQEKLHQALSASHIANISDATKSAIYLNKLYNCNGLEFVASSNVKITEPIVLPNEIILFPCFYKSSGGRQISDPKVDATMKMEMRSRFIYDGWLPIPKMELSIIVSRIDELRSSLSTFSLISDSHFDWQPKYNFNNQQPSTLYYCSDQIGTIEDLEKSFISLSKSDRNALNRSIGWLSQSKLQDDEKSEYLFCVLAIESLCTFIEEKADEDSVFFNLKSEKNPPKERRDERNNCIRRIMHDLLSENPTKAVQDAYFNCVVGIKKRLKEHLERIMGNEDKQVKLFFYSEKEKPSLYELRHFIAHGNMNSLVEDDILRITQNCYDISKLATRYIWRVIHLSLDIYNKSSKIEASFGMSNGFQIIGNRSMYKGPTEIALLY